MSDFTKAFLASSSMAAGDIKLSTINDRAQVEELKQQLESEKVQKNKSEKVKEGLHKLIDDLSEKLDEESYQCKLLTEQLHKKESEMSKIQSEFEEATSQHEVQNLTLKKKYHDNQQELSDQIDNLHKIRHRLEKEKHILEREFENTQMELENNEKIKVSQEKAKKGIETNNFELRKKYEATLKELQAATNAKNQLLKDNLSLSSQVKSNTTSVTMATKTKDTLTNQLNEARAAMEELMKQSSKVYEESRHTNLNYNRMEGEMEDEKERSADLQKQLIKLQHSLTLANKKIENDERVRPGEFEEMKRKLAGRIVELESQLENVLSKCLGLEKVKNHQQMQIENMGAELEKTTAGTMLFTKKIKQSDKYLNEAKLKEASIEKNLDNMRQELRVTVAEVARLKNDLHDSNEVTETHHKNNQRILEEMHELVEQLTEAQKKVMEVEKNMKRIEMEKEALHNALEEAETSVSHENTRYERLNNDLASAKGDFEKVMMEKDSEMESVRKTHQRSMDELQRCLEEENRMRMEVMRERQLLQQELAEVLGIVEETTRGHEDSGKHIKRLLHKITELERELEGEKMTMHNLEKERVVVEEKLSSQALKRQETEMEVAAMERANKTLQSELKDTAAKVEKLKEVANKLVEQKRSLESDIQALQSDLEDRVVDHTGAVEQGRKAVEEASLLAGQLRLEQERNEHLDRTTRSMEGRLKELVGKLHEVEASAMQGGHKVVQALEQRIHELEMELEKEQHHHSESVKALKRQERRLREVGSSCEESLAEHQQLHDLVEQLHHKLKAYKRQVDELEEACKVNSARYRKTQQEMEHAFERASIAETSLCSLKAGSRGSRCSSVVPMEMSKSKRHSRASSEVKLTAPVDDFEF